MRSFVSPACLCLITLFLGLSMPVQAADPNADPAANAIAEREISWKKLLPSFLDDQKKIWLFPTKVARGEHVFPTLAVLGVTAGLVAADPIEARYFRRNES